MKIAPLLAQYLYNHKRLDLPGLGVFFLDDAVTIDTDKQSRPVNLEGVSFESKPSLKETPDLVQFISSQTGKIKPLAAADLDSHLGLALQFLNIGKPFLFEGIGSLVKSSSGEFIFTAGPIINVSLKEQATRETAANSPTEETHDYKSIFYPKKIKTKWRKPVAAFLLVAGLGLAIWGGYTVYKNTTKKESEPTSDTKDETVLIQDTNTATTQKKDSVSPANSIAPVVATTPSGNFKFVLETANAKRAFSRFGKLKTFQWDVQMETLDSQSFKIFMLMPAAAADTTRLLDSLSMLNGRRVYIETSAPKP